MSKKHRKFSSEFKAKVVLELLEGDKSVSEIASKPKPMSSNNKFKSLIN